MPVANYQTVENYLREDSWFLDCNLEASIINTVWRPKQSFLNYLPVKPTMNETEKFPSLISYEQDLTGDEPDFPCDEPRKLSTTYGFCSLEYNAGRINRVSGTFETDKLVKLACQRAFRDFLFSGDTIARLTNMSMSEIRSQEDLLNQGAILREMQNAANHFNTTLGNMLWSGDPANNSANGGYAEFWGLLRLITDTYGTDATLPVAAKSGTQADCATLNSDIKDFGSECVGCEVGSTLYEYLYELEDTIHMRAMLASTEISRAYWVMHPLLWSQIAKHLPCQIAGDGCAVGQINANDGGAGMYARDMRNQMLQNPSLTLNGRTYPVVFDNYIPYTPAADPVSYTSDIFFLTTEIIGSRGVSDTLYMQHINYSMLGEALGVANQPSNISKGWTDGGRYHHVIVNDRRCFDIDTKIEPYLVNLTPQLCGRIQNVKVCPLQAKPEPALS